MNPLLHAAPTPDLPFEVNRWENEGGSTAHPAPEQELQPDKLVARRWIPVTGAHPAPT